MNDELFWDDDYSLISNIAGAIRKDLEKIERTTWAEMWGIHEGRTSINETCK